jgi:hypothetical protein
MNPIVRRLVVGLPLALAALVAEHYGEMTVMTYLACCAALESWRPS